MPNHEELMKLLGLDTSDEVKEDRTPTPLMQQAYVEHLQELMRRYRRRPYTPFEIGDLVTYKGGMAITRTPSAGKPAILVDVFADVPGHEMGIDAHTPYGAEMYNCILASTVDEHADTLVFFYGNTQRLERYAAPFDNEQE